MKYLIERLSEPSTYGSLAGLALLFGVPQEIFNEYVKAIAGVFFFVQALAPEKGTKK